MKRDDAYRDMTVIGAAETNIREGKPRTAVEIVLELQARGCRTSDDPRTVLRALRESFRYHKGWFQRDGEGKWVLVLS